MPPKTSGKAAVKSGKATKAVTKGDKKKRKGKRKESYAIYIYKVCSDCSFHVYNYFRCSSKSTQTLESPPRP